ncbi:MAG: type IX secretion system sortase PorU [Bacteroidia bacterium]
MRNLFLLILITFGLGLAANSLFAQRIYTENSVLNQGTWYKLAITGTGIYQLDRAYLQQIGIGVDNIDPRNIRMYGHDGGMLPQLNSASRYDDLREMAIEVTGESDGRFDNGDVVRFFARGPHVWEYDEANDLFGHSYHLYSDTSYVFLSVGETGGKRIATLQNQPATYTAANLRSQLFHEQEQYNLLKSGRYWMGENFDLNLEREFDFQLPDLDPNGEVRITVRAGARADRTTTMTVTANGTGLGSMSFGSVSVTRYEARFKRNNKQTFTLSAQGLSNTLRVKLAYSKGGYSLAEAWLDWIEIDYDRSTDLSGSLARQMALTDGVGAGQVAEINFTNAGSSVRIWDVTDVTSPVALDLVSGKVSIPAEKARRLVSVSGTYSSPAGWKSVANQNLHQPQSIDYLIITHPLFREAADKLAAMHEVEYGQTTKVVYTSQIFNEFSAGTRDVTAIRDYIKMIYDRSGGTQPQAVVLMGDGTYDYKNITGSEVHRNYVMTYQSRESDSPTTSYTSDDFFGFMEPHEGDWGEGVEYSHQYGHTIDVPIGRLPVETMEEANAVVDKLTAYVENTVVQFGEWRQRLVLVADYKEGEGATHMNQANGYSPLIEANSPETNIDKIFLDNYTAERTAGGLYFPDARRAMLDQFDRGALIINYTGHGGENAWSNATLLSLADIEAMQNGPRQPCVVTATCEFGRWDDHSFRSGGELFFLRNEGGAIAMFTTVRLVYSYPNERLNRNFYEEVFTYDSLKGRMPTVGEVMMRTKNQTFANAGDDINSRNFTLLGDPGLILAYPELKAQITSINNMPFNPAIPDTLRSLGKVAIEGIITDKNGSHIQDFNGDMSVTVFDKPNKYFGKLVPSFTFFWQNSRIFSGNVEVKDGNFRFEFVTPLDISYEDGKGKISLYFNDEYRDGGGAYNNLVIGGTDPDAEPDFTGPEVQLYMNDEYWKDGGTTGPDPYLYAKVFDENGINTATGGVGHELIAFLDGDEANPIVLNDYYTAANDDFRAGTIYYQLKDLEEGPHELKLVVWDVANNPAEARTDFIVVTDALLAITEILGYPNPANLSNNDVGFLIGHNFQGRELEATVRILSTDGRLLHTLSSEFLASGNYYRGLRWNGESMDGNPVPPGMYVFDVSLRDKDSGRVVRKASKLVVLR